MSTAELNLESIPKAEVIPPRYDEAAQLLDRAIKAGCQDPSVHYLLGLAYKHQGKIAEARAAFRRIGTLDANTCLQLGLLALDEEQYVQAEEEFARALQLDPAAHEACFNLLMTRLTLGKIAEGAGLVDRAIELAATPEDRRFLGLLRLLLSCTQNRGSDIPVRSRIPGGQECPPHETLEPLRELTAPDEARLLRLVRSLGDVDSILALLRPLRAARPHSSDVQETYFEALLGKGRLMVERSDWFAAERLLAPCADDPALDRIARPMRAAFFNLLGCCACLNQDFAGGLEHFQSALDCAGEDPRIHQNMALAQEWAGSLSQAEPHWNEFLDLLDNRWPCPPEMRNYPERLAFETLSRLATSYSEMEKWGPALGFIERAQRVRPNDPEVLERLFHLYQQNKKSNQARRTLARLRELRPNEPQYELYELDFIDVKNLSDVDHMLTEIDDILRRHPGDSRVDERAVGMVRNVVPLLGSLCDQLTDQMSRVIDQVRRLPHYQINWRAVHDVMGDLRREFNKLRRIAGKCLPLVRNEEHHRIIRDLINHIERKIDVCQQMGG